MKYLCVILLILLSAAASAPVDNDIKTLHVPNEKSTAAPGSILHKEEMSVKKLTTTEKPHIVEIVESGSEHKMDGSYHFHFRGSDGSFREETAVVKNPGTKHEYLEVTGAYSFFDTDGKEVVVHYKAGDRGFVPVGNNIPDEISVAAKENSELPAIDLFEDEDDEDDDDDKVHVVNNNSKKKMNN